MALQSFALGGITVAGLALLFQLYAPSFLQNTEDVHAVLPLKSAGISPKRVDKLKFVVVTCDLAFNYKDNIIGISSPSINGLAIPFYRLTYYIEDHTMEMIFSKDGKTWLTRSVVADIKRTDLFVGSSIIVKEKCFTVSAYSNGDTQESVESGMQSTLALIKPDAMDRVGEVLTELATQHTHLNIAGLRLLRFTSSQAQNFYAEHKNKFFFETLVKYMSGGPILAVHLRGPNAVMRWREALGPTDSNVARTSAPQSMRAKFGTDKEQNAAHGSDGVAAARRELSSLFPGWSDSSLPGLSSVAEMLDDSSCLVLPHLIKDGEFGSLLTSLRKHHNAHIVKAEAVRFNLLDAARYATGQLLPLEQNEKLQDTINELMSGVAVFLKLKALDSTESAMDFGKRFKDIVGPKDPAKARKSSVQSCRAVYGKTESRSALLCPLFDWNKS